MINLVFAKNESLHPSIRMEQQKTGLLLIKQRLGIV